MPSSSKSAARMSPRLYDGRSRLSDRQLVILIAIGVGLWFLVALAIRVAPDLLFARGFWTVLMFALALPNAWVTIWATRRLVPLTPDQIVPGAAVASAAAMLCDGVGLTWTTLYGHDAEHLVPVAAFLLWGVANILVAGFMVARRAGA